MWISFFYTWFMETFIHPERREEEVFFTNATARQFKLMRWDSKRLGKVPYDGEGNRQEYKNWFPVFLAKTELENVKADINAERKTWRQIMDQLDLNPNYK